MKKQLLVITRKNGNRTTVCTHDEKWCVRDGHLCFSSFDYPGAFPAASIDIETLESYKAYTYFNTFSDFLEAYGKSMQQFSVNFDIPYRTVQDWKSGVRNPPRYVLNMLTIIANL